MKKTLLYALILTFSLNVYADKYVLKNGMIIIGNLTKETNTHCTVSAELIGEVTFLKDQVREIIKETLLQEKSMLKVYKKPVKISVMDFEIQSNNPQYANLGKGFSEFVSVEVFKSKDISLIEREKRREIIEEQKFALTGLVDEKNSIEIGKMLAANYLVTGNIIDTMNKLSITFRVLDTETGQVILQEKLEEDPSKYDYISAFIAKAVLNNFSAQVSSDTEAKLVNSQNKSVEAAVKFSRAVDSYDNKRFETARKDLLEAKKLDPANEAVKYYYNKLFKNTTKFKVAPERYISYQNPAYLSLLDSDSLFLTGNGAHPITPFIYIPGGVLGVGERGDRSSYGYFLPILKGLGFGIEYFYYIAQDSILKQDPNSPGETVSNNDVIDSGVIITAGLKITDNISIGFGTSLYNQDRTYYIAHAVLPPPLNSRGQRIENNPALAYDIGLLLKDNTNSIIFDSYFAVTNENFYLYNSSTKSNQTYRMPSILENTLSFALNNNQTFFVVKQYDYFYTDISYFIGNVMPAAEQWFFNAFSLRAGYEFAYFDLSGTKSNGNGFTLGITLPVDFIVKFTVDYNYTSRQRPSRNLEGLKVEETIGFLTVTFTDIFQGKKKN